jgi:uroporphyrinogen decarboxylase
LESYRAHDWDFIKLNPRWTFFAEAWGNQYQRPTEQRFPRLLDAAVKSVADFERVRFVDPSAGVFGEQLDALKLVLAEVGDEVDVLYTVFSPVSVLGLICGGVGQPLVNFAAEDPAATHDTLATVTRVLRQHAQLAIESGAAGVFAPLQWSSRRVCRRTSTGSLPPVRPPGSPAIRGWTSTSCTSAATTTCSISLDYPVAAINWADRGGQPVACRGRRKTGVTLMGDRERPYPRSHPDDVRAQARDALAACPTASSSPVDGDLAAHTRGSQGRRRRSREEAG